MKLLKILFAPIAAAIFGMIIWSACAEKASADLRYDIAPREYEALTEQYLQHLARFEWEDSYAFLADDVEFKYPDGDTDTRTTYKGLDQVRSLWDNYLQQSGNDKIVIKDFVHVPVRVNQELDHVEVTGVFNLCYFSAELTYGAQKANVRMHWAFHFNEEKKIDGIYTYYDRTPIIEAARKNFLAAGNHGEKVSEGRVVQVIRLKSDLPEATLLQTARERAASFRTIPGLLQKYYTRLDQPGHYSGIYVWDSMESLQQFRQSELAATIAQAYKVTQAPSVEVSDLLFQLRE